MLNKAIFLDRDGVVNRTLIINKKPYAPRKIEDFKLMPNLLENISLLKKKKFLLIIITNQPDIGNGLMKRKTLNLMHKKLLNNAPIDDIFVCSHSQNQNCRCRKPKNGLIIKAKKKYNINLAESYLIGDRSIDIQAGKISNCKTIFIDRKYNESSPTSQIITVTSLKSAVKYLIKNNA